MIRESTKAYITSAMAWRDQISGDYLLNLQDSKDVGMWSFKISEKDYQDLKVDGVILFVLKSLQKNHGG